MNTTEMLIVERDSAGSTNQSLSDCVKQALENYFSHLDGHSPAGLYDFVLEAIEIPMLEVVMKYAKGNQCKASNWLKISRGTLRKKLKQYGLD